MTPEKRFEKNQKLIYGAIHKFYPAFASDEDMVAEAERGMWISCCKFDEKRGTSFSTFAYQYVRNYCMMYLRKKRTYPETIEINENHSKINDISITFIEDEEFIKRIPNKNYMRETVYMLLNHGQRIINEKQFEIGKKHIEQYIKSRENAKLYLEERYREMDRLKNEQLYPRYGMTVEEASDYFRIGENRIRSIVKNNPYEDFYMLVGNRIIIKRPAFEIFLTKIHEL